MVEMRAAPESSRTDPEFIVDLDADEGRYHHIIHDNVKYVAWYSSDKSTLEQWLTHVDASARLLAPTPEDIESYATKIRASMEATAL